MAWLPRHHPSIGTANHAQRPRKPLVPWTEEQVRGMLALAAATPRDHLLISLGHAFPLHATHIPLIRREDVDLDTQQILLPTGPRSAREAHRIPDHLVPALAAHLRTHTGEFLFTGRHPQLLATEALYRVKKYAVQAGYATWWRKPRGNMPRRFSSRFQGQPRRPLPHNTDPRTGRAYKYRPTNALRTDEVDQLLTIAARQTGRFAQRDYVVLATTYLYGLRPGEPELMLADHVDLRHRRIYITREKGSESRWYPLFDDLVAPMARYLAERPLPKNGPQVLPYEQNFLFPNKNIVHVAGAPRVYGMQARSVNRVVVKLAAKAGLRRPKCYVRGYCLRHSIAVHLLEAGWDLDDIQHLFGHKSIASTQLYARLMDAHLWALLREVEQSPHVARF